MADKRLTDLPAAGAAGDTDLYYVVQGLSSRSQTLGQLKTVLGTNNANLQALAGLTGAADRLPYFTGVGALSLATLTSFARSLLDDANAGAARSTLGIGNVDNTSDANKPVSTATQNALDLKAPLASPTFTGAPKAPTAAVGDNSTSIATTAFVQAAIANKRAWTSYTPTVTAGAGTFTSISATGKYMVAFGICHFQVVITVTTKGTGSYPNFTLPFPALAGSALMPMPCREGAGINGKFGAAYITAGLATATCTDYTNADLATANGAVIYVNGSYPIA